MGKLKALQPRVPILKTQRVQSMQPGSWRTDKTSSTARGYGYAWQQLRSKHLAAHPFCAMCLQELGIEATEPAAIIVECATRGIAAPYGNVADHVVPHRGRRDLQLDPGNVQTLCVAHHSGAKQRMEHGQHG